MEGLEDATLRKCGGREGADGREQERGKVRRTEGLKESRMRSKNRKVNRRTRMFVSKGILDSELSAKVEGLHLE